MALLDNEHYNRVIVKGKEAVHSLKNGEIENFFKLSEIAWNEFPEPKENWNQSFNFLKMVLKNSLKLKRFDEFEKWLKRFESVEKNLNLGEEEYLFYKGVYHFENSQFEISKEVFNQMFKVDKGRSFEDQDPKYKDFYLNPEKYIKE